jgi:predicted HicB family RNase H-like nuclease
MNDRLTAHVALTRDLYRQVVKAAKARGWSVSQWIRHTIIEALQHRFPTEKEPTP